MASKKISMAVIKRLPRYHRYLNDLLSLGIKRISSKELSTRMGITASQIRQDLNCFGVFDVNQEIIGKTIKDVEVMHMNNLEEFVKNNKVDIAMLCVPFKETASIADKVAKLGIRGLWNFSPMDLKIPYDVIVENVHLSDSLMVLGYKLNERFERE